MEIGNSDVVLAITFETPEQMDEVLAIYAMDSLVQKHDTVGEWIIRRDLSHPIMVFSKKDVPWSDDHEEARAVERVVDVARSFMNERGFEFGAYFLRFGTEPEDIEDSLYGTSTHLAGTAKRSVQFNRSIEIDI